MHIVNAPILEAAPLSSFLSRKSLTNIGFPMLLA
jgi:hypothetical protein